MKSSYQLQSIYILPYTNETPSTTPTNNNKMVVIHSSRAYHTRWPSRLSSQLRGLVVFGEYDAGRGTPRSSQIVWRQSFEPERGGRVVISQVSINTRLDLC
jgi:hypothetical protein